MEGAVIKLDFFQTFKRGNISKNKDDNNSQKGAL